MARVLTADLGNSRLKLRLFRCAEGAGAVLESAVNFDRGPKLCDATRSWLDSEGALDQAGLSSVAGEEDAARIATLLESASSELRVAPEAGLEIRCREPQTVGRDRLYAARGALEVSAGEPVMILDCGTALTVDAAEGSAFLGGAIAAGPELLAAALGAGTAQLFAIEPAPLAPALGKDTGSALNSGVVHGLRGAAMELLAKITEEAGFDSPLVVVTGGAARFLVRPPIHSRLVEDPDLVHRGLLLALGWNPADRPA